MPASYTERDADLRALHGRSLAIVDYTDLGRAFALNLRDNGYKPIIGAVNENRANRARAEGFEVQSPEDAAHNADVKILTLPDEQVAEVYLSHVAPGLRADDMLVFASGYNLAFGLVEPPPFVDAVMIAPRVFGDAVRDAFVSGRGFLSFVSVAQDATGQAWRGLLALASALGALKLGALEVTFRQESELAQFVDQAVLPALHYLLASAADILLREGYPPEAAFGELYLSGRLSDALHNASLAGLAGMVRGLPLIEQFGLLSRLDRFTDPKLRRQMETILDEARRGQFAGEWTNEYHNGYPRMEALRRKHEAQPLWETEKRAVAALRPSVDKPEA